MPGCRSLAGHDAAHVEEATWPPAVHQLCTTSGWCWQNPIPTSTTLLGAWGSSNTDIHAVGHAGTLLHYNGVRWKLHPAVPGFDKPLYRVSGQSPAEVYAVGAGGILRYDGKSWSSDWHKANAALSVIQADSGGTFAGGTGLFLERKAGSWQVTPGAETLSALYRTPGGKLLGSDGDGVLEWNGANWLGHSTAPTVFYAMWQGGSGPLFGATFSGIQENSGGNWSELAVVGSYYDIWGAGSTAYAVGAKDGLSSQALRYENGTWTEEPAPGAGLQGVWGDGKGFVLAVGNQGVVAVREPSKGWRDLEPRPRTTILAGHATAAIAVAGGDGQLLWRDGNRWRGTPVAATITAMWGSGETIWAGTNKGDVHPVSFEGGAATLGPAKNLGRQITSISGTSPSDIYASTIGGKIYHYDGKSWTSYRELSTTLHQLAAIAPGDLLLASTKGLTRSKGAAEEVDLVADKKCNRVAVASDTEAYAYCSGTIYRWDGTTAAPDLQLDAGETVYALRSAGGKTWAAGNNGRLWRRTDASKWELVPVGATADLRALFGRPTDLYVAGNFGTILHEGP